MNEICNISPSNVVVLLRRVRILVLRRALQLPPFHPAGSPSTSSIVQPYDIIVQPRTCSYSVFFDLAHLPSDYRSIITLTVCIPVICATRCNVLSAVPMLIHPNLALGVATLGPRFTKPPKFTAPPRLRMSKRRERRTTTGATCGRGTLNEGNRKSATWSATSPAPYSRGGVAQRWRGSMLHECRSRAWRRSATTAR